MRGETAIVRWREIILRHAREFQSNAAILSKAERRVRLQSAPCEGDVADECRRVQERVARLYADVRVLMDVTDEGT